MKANSADVVPYRAKTKADDEVIAQALAILDRRVNKGQELTSPHDTRSFFAVRLANLEHEVFGVLFLDSRHRVLAFDEMFRGTFNGTSVYPREVAKRALELNAAAVIFTHNHPSGGSEPSRADEVLTERLKECLSLLEVRVLDHIVVGGGQWVSFAERGLL